MKVILGMCVKVLLVLLLAGGIIGVLGYKLGWDTSIAYSNAFFFAGCLLIVAGTSSRFIASQEWNVFQQLHAESFRDMSIHERRNFIIEASSSVSLLVLGVVSGVLLIVVAILVTTWF
jgi:hypothetical protein